MEDKIYQSYLEILQEELVPALGCTEPIALAYAAASAREVFGGMPGHMDVFCSGNIIKNVKNVTVPNSGGMHGIEAAAVLGAVGGRADRKLEVLEAVTEQDREQVRDLLDRKFCTCHLQKGVENLYIRVEMTGKAIMPQLPYPESIPISSGWRRTERSFLQRNKQKRRRRSRSRIKDSF